MSVSKAAVPLRPLPRVWLFPASGINCTAPGFVSAMLQQRAQGQRCLTALHSSGSFEQKMYQSTYKYQITHKLELTVHLLDAVYF